ncbi:hypothetical protein KP509_18G009700 [Ceratopteris richardii]|uniref:Uncharacterized protein n=1 Tax=Ceratopteris richardii TaxID=49495 RepID=A0A8T2SN82_CERRI|nr:hypothetical protein KP509_18G009700 [Ceratopteris richardii]
MKLSLDLLPAILAHRAEGGNGFTIVSKSRSQQSDVALSSFSITTVSKLAKPFHAPAVQPRWLHLHLHDAKLQSAFGKLLPLLGRNNTCLMGRGYDTLSFFLSDPEGTLRIRTG